MKLKLWIMPLLCLYFVLISASFTSVENPAPVVEKAAAAEAAPAVTEQKSMKLNFIQKALLKRATKKYKLDENGEVMADKHARIALIFGVSALSLLLIGLFVPYVIFASLPAAIVAMVYGSSALRKGTQFDTKARLGKGFGLGSLIAFGALLVLALIWIASWGGLWG